MKGQNKNSLFKASVATGSARGRVNLIGEHIDYNGGTVLPASISREVTVGLTPRADDLLEISSSRFDDTVSRSLTEPANSHWSDYIVGALSLAHKKGWIQSGMNIVIDSNIPDGAGVSSSAALIIAIFRACLALNGESKDPKDVAILAREVETDFIGVPCGIMDQMATSLINPGQALILDTLNNDTQTIDIPDTWSFITIHTGIHRKLSDGRYKERAIECQEAKELLKQNDLCHITPEEEAELTSLPEILQKRVTHVTSEHKRVLRAIEAMRMNNMALFGQLMVESHKSYSHDFEASTHEIDLLIESALTMGALGARLTGGGFGGCMVALVQKTEKEQWMKDFAARHKNVWEV